MHTHICQYVSCYTCYVQVSILQSLCCVRRYKQRGQAAEAADNVFHHLTYEGAVDVEHMADKQQRAALESQINEFGQCPRQVTAP